MGIVQTKQGAVAGAAPNLTLTITLDNPTAAGNSLIVVAAASGSSANPTAITCKLGGVVDNFVQDSTFGSSGDAAIGATWRDQPCAGGQTSVTVIVATGTGTLATEATVYECDDLTASPFDKTANSVSAGSTSWTSTATATTAQANERLFGAVFCTQTGSQPAITGPIAPWANLTQVNVTQATFLDSWMSGWQDVAAVAAYTYNGTVAPSSQWIAKIVTYKLLTGPVASGGVAHQREHRQHHVGRRHRMQRQQKQDTFGVPEPDTLYPWQLLMSGTRGPAVPNPTGATYT